VIKKNNLKVDEKVFIVTGANSGVGKATALGLALTGATVLMVCRNKNKGESARQEIIRESGNSKIELLLADFDRLDSIREMVKDFKSKYDRLDALCNVAGIISPSRQVTQDGIEKNLAVNYLSHFLLTNLLLDILKKSSPSRIINIAGSPGTLKNVKINFDDIQYENHYNWIKAALQSAFARAVFTFELAKHLDGSGVTANVFHPGYVKSNLGNNLPVPLRWAASLGQLFLSKKSITSVYLATSPEVETINGKFFAFRKPIKFTPPDYTSEVGERLWKLSEELTKSV
jgi:NAD(P)-dependent dehydrogenase (short-subunit alcohol dehydrogenase family)